MKVGTGIAREQVLHTPELLLEIFSYLEFPDLLAAAHVCRKWCETSDTAFLWEPSFGQAHALVAPRARGDRPVPAAKRLAPVAILHAKVRRELDDQWWNEPYPSASPREQKAVLVAASLSGVATLAAGHSLGAACQISAATGIAGFTGAKILRGVEWRRRAWANWRRGMRREAAAKQANFDTGPYGTPIALDKLATYARGLAESGDGVRLRKLLPQGIPLNIPDAHGATVLELSLNHWDDDLTTELVQSGAYVTPACVRAAWRHESEEQFPALLAHLRPDLQIDLMEHITPEDVVDAIEYEHNHTLALGLALASPATLEGWFTAPYDKGSPESNSIYAEVTSFPGSRVGQLFRQAKARVDRERAQP